MEKSFKKQVNLFWRRFQKKEAEIRNMIDSNSKIEMEIEMVDEMLKICFTNPLFQIGYSKEINKYELVITPEGNYLALPQVYYWYSQAPKSIMDVWHFSYTKEAVKDISKLVLKMHGIVLDYKNVNVYLLPDSEEQKFDVQIFSADLLTLEEEQAYQMIFVLLDLVFGELFVMEHMGMIDLLEINEVDVGEYVNLLEVNTWVREIMEEEEWDNRNLFKTYIGYEMDPKELNCEIREDIFFGYTKITALISTYLVQEYEDITVFHQDGMYYGYIFYDNTFLSEESVLEYQIIIEGDVLPILEERKIGSIIGSATGIQNSYIDFVIFDKIEFFKVMRSCCSQLGILMYYSDFDANSGIVNLQALA